MDSTTTLDEITGSLESIIFSSEDTGFTVATLKEPKKESTTAIVGVMPTITPGETLYLKGSWKFHPKHGKQFQVSSLTQEAPFDAASIQKYLESGMIKGIGAAYAKRIVEKFGPDTLKIIDESPKKLSEIEGIGEKRIKQISKYWNDQKSVRHIMIFLQSQNIKPSLAQKIYKAYGEKSIETVKSDPYALAKNLFGVGFKTADTIAANLGISKNSPNRIRAGIEYFLWEASSIGHVCYPKETLCSEVATMLEIEPPEIENELKSLLSDDTLHKESSEDGEEYYWVKPLYFSEIGITNQLERLIQAPCNIRKVKVDNALVWVQEQMRIKLAKEQKSAIEKSFIEKLHIITGGPGTGKSTITNGILRITEKITDRILLAAPTGRAAKRLSEITRKKSFTIHSILEYDFQTGKFRKNKDNPLSCDLIIIDEASMIDTQLMFHLLKAIPDSCRIIFIGDIDQLPSVGPGNVLKDLIDSEKIPTTTLKKIFRQGAGSMIIKNAHSINNGYFPNLSNPDGTDFIFLESNCPEEITKKILHLVKHELPRKFHLDPLDDIQVLAPMRKGGVGVEHLNHLLQQHLNPSETSFSKFGKTFHLGDKVMQIRNNYDKKVYNGDIGRISLIDPEEQEVQVNFFNKPVIYDFSECEELTLAYAASVHKYQGSECPCIVFPIHISHFKLLNKNLIYTAITRGKKLVVLIGEKRALAVAINNKEIFNRYTYLKNFIKNKF